MASRTNQNESPCLYALNEKSRKKEENIVNINTKDLKGFLTDTVTAKYNAVNINNGNMVLNEDSVTPNSLTHQKRILNPYSKSASPP